MLSSRRGVIAAGPVYGAQPPRTSTSGCSRDDEVGDLPELRPSVAGSLGERFTGGRVGAHGERARLVEPELRDVRALAEALVGAVVLAKVLVAADDVEDVVDDLEQHAQLG